MEEPEDINELFPTIDNPLNFTDSNMNKTFDIRKIDVKRLVEKLGAFNVTNEDMSTIDARRQVIPVYYAGSWWYDRAIKHMTKQKATDLMLQHIYMARHVMKELESNPNFSQEDTGYKVGLLYNKLRTLYEKMQTIYEMMFRKRWLYGTARQHVLLHQISVKLHTDFVFIWKLLIKVDAKYREINGERPKLPKSIITAGGITDDEFAPKIG